MRWMAWFILVFVVLTIGIAEWVSWADDYPPTPPTYWETNEFGYVVPVYVFGETNGSGIVSNQSNANSTNLDWGSDGIITGVCKVALVGVPAVVIKVESNQASLPTTLENAFGSTNPLWRQEYIGSMQLLSNQMSGGLLQRQVSGGSNAFIRHYTNVFKGVVNGFFGSTAVISSVGSTGFLSVGQTPREITWIPELQGLTASQNEWLSTNLSLGTPKTAVLLRMCRMAVRLFLVIGCVAALVYAFAGAIKFLEETNLNTTTNQSVAGTNVNLGAQKVIRFEMWFATLGLISIFFGMGQFLTPYVMDIFTSSGLVKVMGIDQVLAQYSSIGPMLAWFFGPSGFINLAECCVMVAGTVGAVVLIWATSWGSRLVIAAVNV